MNILFICTGNTCRSPMAEGYLTTKGKTFSVKSCGLFADGSPVSENSKKVMAEIGVDISGHISKQIDCDLIKWADKIICMSPSHKEMLESIGITNATVLGNGILDPYGATVEVYRLCRDQIIKEIDELFLDFEILPIEHRHLNDIAQLEKICFSTPWSQNAITEAFTAGTKFFVAISNNKVLGYVGLSAILDEGYITNIAVYPEHRNKGVATALLKTLFDFALENNLSFISLEVRQSNITAISVYEKLGFKKEGLRKGFYSEPKEDALIMTKRFD